MAASASRACALKLIGKVRKNGSFARDVVRASAEYEALDSRDQALCMRIVMGVTATVGRLDAVIDRHASKPKKIEPLVRDCLRIGAYELLYLATPARAAVNEGVELVKGCRAGAARFANAILRSIDREDVAAFKDARAAVAAGTDDVAAIALAAGLPDWLVGRVIDSVGAEAACRLALAQDEPAPVYVTNDPWRLGYDVWRDRLAELGFKPRETELTRVLSLGAPAGFPTSNIYDASIVSDLAAQAVARVACPADAHSILEIGQGRATKSMLMAAIAKDARCDFKLVGVDSQAFKTRIARKRLKHTGLNATCVAVDGTTLASDVLPEGAPSVYDTVFLDAPCSGTGTLRRHPEICWSLTEADLESLAGLQLSLLTAASSRVKPGGTLVYATCSVLTAENAGVVEAFLASAEGAAFRLAPCADAPMVDDSTRAFLAGHAIKDGVFATSPAPGACDGHFAARLVRI